jgi:heptosyltransferase-1
MMKVSELALDPRKVLIVKPSSLGDIVHSLPFLNAIKTSFPEAVIHWVIARGFEGLLEGHPMIEKLWVIDKDTWKKISNVKETIGELHALFQNLKREKYDLVVDLQGLLRSGMITRATRSPIRIGFKEAREGSRFFYTHKVEGGKDIHAVDRYLKIAAFLGCEISDVRFPFPEFDSSSFILPPSTFQDYIVLVPGARWDSKRWPPENFGRLAALLPLNSLIVGSKGDKDISDKIVSQSKSKSVSLAGKTTLKELVQIVRGAKFVVTNDSGPMHIAAALGIPIFAIFGPTDAARTGPYGRGHTVIREEVSCAPCFKKKCDDMRCIRNLSVEKVYKIIGPIIKKEI